MAVIAEFAKGDPRLLLEKRPLHQSPSKITPEKKNQKKTEDLDTNSSSPPSHLICSHISENKAGQRKPITHRAKGPWKQNIEGGGACTRAKTLHVFRLGRNKSRLRDVTAKIKPRYQIERRKKMSGYPDFEMRDGREMVVVGSEGSPNSKNYNQLMTHAQDELIWKTN